MRGSGKVEACIVIYKADGYPRLVSHREQARGQPRTVHRLSPCLVGHFQQVVASDKDSRRFQPITTRIVPFQSPKLAAIAATFA